MTKIIKHIIADSDNGFLNFDLRDLLTLISDGEKYSWTLADMDVTILNKDNQPTDTDYKLIESINNNQKSQTVTWADLKRLTKLDIQTIDGTITAQNSDQKIEISAFDSSYWTVSTIDLALSERLQKRFKDITISKT